MLYSSWAISYLSYNWQESQFSIPRHTLQRFDTFASTTQSKTDLAEIESENTCSKIMDLAHSKNAIYHDIVFNCKEDIISKMSLSESLR